jgi:hypothetical protein
VMICFPLRVAILYLLHLLHVHATLHRNEMQPPLGAHAMAEKPDLLGERKLSRIAMQLAEEAVIAPSAGGEWGRPCARIPPGVSERAVAG